MSPASRLTCATATGYRKPSDGAPWGLEVVQHWRGLIAISCACAQRNAHLLVARCPFSEFHYCRASALAEHKERCPDRSESIYSGEATEEMRMLERQMAVVSPPARHIRSPARPSVPRSKWWS